MFIIYEIRFYIYIYIYIYISFLAIDDIISHRHQIYGRWKHQRK